MAPVQQDFILWFSHGNQEFTDGVHKRMTLMHYIRILLIPMVGTAFLPGGLTADGNPHFIETYKAAWKIINESYYDEDFHGLDWNAVYEAHLPAVEAADDMETLRMILRTMLGKLGQSHFSLIEQPEPALKDRLVGEDGSSHGDSGMEVTLVDNRVLVNRVRDGSPADEAGIRPGAWIVSIDGRPLASLAADFSVISAPARLREFYFIREIQERLQGKPGDKLDLLVRGATDEEQTFRLELEASPFPRSQKFANLPAHPLDWEVKALQGGICYLRFNFFAFDLMDDLLHAIKGAEGGLIIDLRGNPGGIGAMATALTGYLVDAKLKLGTMQIRDGSIHYLAHPQPEPYLGPIAILIDRRTASTGEIFTSGLQCAGRAMVYGRPTAGAVLPSMIQELPNGDLLQYVVGDFETAEGISLEGRGVQPDIEVKLTREALLAGRDPDLEAAMKRLKEGI